MLLSKAEADAITARSAQLESRVGVQVIAAIIGKADAHVELPWKAFALGTVLSGLAVVIADLARPQWLTANVALVDAVTILGTGAASALLAVFVPAYARFFLRSTRRDAEVRRYAEALFLRHELFKTRERNGILILVSCFERKVEIVADLGLHRRVSDVEWRPVIARMRPLLRERRFAEALQEGLAAAEELLAAKGLNATVDAGAENELPDRPIDEGGES
jgi:putative membrane protein